MNAKQIVLIFSGWLMSSSIVGFVVADVLIREHGSVVVFVAFAFLGLIAALVHLVVAGRSARAANDVAR